MSRNLVIAVVVILVLIVGGWLLTRPKQPAMSSPETQSTQAPASTESAAPTSTASEGAMMKKDSNLVKITANGFSPKSITVKTGESITWENTDSSNHTVNSDNHPTHLLYPFLNLGVIKPGDKKSVASPKAGTFTYHDHLNPSLTGSVTVQ